MSKRFIIALRGFIDGIFPEILRHPANYQIITMPENSSKRDKCSITLEELFNRIESYQDVWVEQETCLELISKYRVGERFIYEKMDTR